MRDDDSSSVSSAGRDDLPGPVTFGPFRLLLAARRLERRGKTVNVGGRALDILIALAARPGHVVSKVQLSQAAWPGMVVEEANLRFHIAELRKVLGRDSSGESFITTVAGRGYHLAAPVDAQASTADDDPGPALVGREAEEAELERLLNRAAAGEAQFAFVTGEAGVGKTALTARFARHAAAGARAVIGCCLPGNAETDPYYPILDVLMRLADTDGPEDFRAVVSRVAPTWAIQLPMIADEAVAGSLQDVLGATHHRISRELCALLEIVAKQQPLVLVLEDIQWADQATLDLLRQIAHRRLTARLLIVATLRYPGTAPAASVRSARLLCESLCVYHLATEIPLSTLTRDDVGEYLTRMSGQRPALELSLHLHARSGGNPLFMRTMIDYWLQTGLVTPDPSGWALPGAHGVSELKAPPTLARLIEGEIELLKPDRQHVIDAASVSEGMFSAAISHVASPFDEAAFEEACEDLARTTGLIRRAEALSLPDGRRVQGYAFRHVILRDVAYERQSASRRAAAHAAVAAEMENVYRRDPAPVASTLARHFLEAQDWISAVKYLRLAARVALRRFSRREAVTALEQALAGAAHLPADQRLGAEVEIKEELATILAGALDPRAPALCDQVVAEAAAAGRPDILCRALLGQAQVLGWTDLSASLDRSREALLQSDTLTDPAARAWIRSQAHGWCSFAVGGDLTHDKGCEAAIEDLRRLSDPVALNAGLVNHTLVLFTSSRYLEAHQTLIASIEVLNANARDDRIDLTLAHWLWRLGVPLSLLYAGRLGPAFDAFQSGVQAMLRNGDAPRAAHLQFHGALGHIFLQDFDAAAALVEAAAKFSPTVEAVAMGLNEKQMGMVVGGLAAHGLGRPAEALDRLTQARADALRRPTVTSWLWRMVIAWGMTDACLAAGDVAAARARAEELHALAYRTRKRTWRALACETDARVALASGELPTAQARLHEGWKEVELGPLPLAEWRLHAVEAAVRSAAGDLDGAAGHRQACADALAALAQTLPEGHSARKALGSAQPIFAA
jgi:DNA-binding winged helix-turn-helix (wHTH) protein